MAHDADFKSRDFGNWQGLLIRYLLGSIVGAICVGYALIKVHSNDRSIVLKLFGVSESQISTTGWYVLFVIGFAYSYIGSAPILVLHASRLISWKRLLKENCFIHVLGIMLLFGLAFGMERLFQIVWHSGDYCLYLVIYLQLFILWNRFRCKTSQKDSIALAKARQNEDNVGFVESYRHLREYGNSFFIALTTMTFTYILLHQNLGLGITTLLWVTPAALVWFVATELERNFLKKE